MTALVRPSHRPVLQVSFLFLGLASFSLSFSFQVPSFISRNSNNDLSTTRSLTSTPSLLQAVSIDQDHHHHHHQPEPSTRRLSSEEQREQMSRELDRIAPRLHHLWHETTAVFGLNKSNNKNEKERLIEQADAEVIQSIVRLERLQNDLSSLEEALDALQGNEEVGYLDFLDTKLQKLASSVDNALNVVDETPSTTTTSHPASSSRRTVVATEASSSAEPSQSQRQKERDSSPVNDKDIKAPSTLDDKDRLWQNVEDCWRQFHELMGRMDKELQDLEEEEGGPKGGGENDKKRKESPIAIRDSTIRDPSRKKELEESLRSLDDFGRDMAMAEQQAYMESRELPPRNDMSRTLLARMQDVHREMAVVRQALYGTDEPTRGPVSSSLPKQATGTEPRRQHQPTESMETASQPPRGQRPPSLFVAEDMMDVIQSSSKMMDEYRSIKESRNNRNKNTDSERGIVDLPRTQQQRPPSVIGDVPHDPTRGRVSREQVRPSSQRGRSGPSLQQEFQQEQQQQQQQRQQQPYDYPTGRIPQQEIQGPNVKPPENAGGFEENWEVPFSTQSQILVGLPPPNSVQMSQRHKRNQDLRDGYDQPPDPKDYQSVRDWAVDQENSVKKPGVPWYSISRNSNRQTPQTSPRPSADPPARRRSNGPNGQPVLVRQTLASQGIGDVLAPPEEGQGEQWRKRSSVPIHFLGDRDGSREPTPRMPSQIPQTRGTTNNLPPTPIGSGTPPSSEYGPGGDRPRPERQQQQQQARARQPTQTATASWHNDKPSHTLADRVRAAASGMESSRNQPYPGVGQPVSRERQQYNARHYPNQQQQQPQGREISNERQQYNQLHYPEHRQQQNQQQQRQHSEPISNERRQYNERHYSSHQQPQHRQPHGEPVQANPHSILQVDRPSTVPRDQTKMMDDPGESSEAYAAARSRGQQQMRNEREREMQLQEQQRQNEREREMQLQEHQQRQHHQQRAGGPHPFEARPPYPPPPPPPHYQQEPPPPPYWDQQPPQYPPSHQHSPRYRQEQQQQYQQEHHQQHHQQQGPQQRQQQQQQQRGGENENQRPKMYERRDQKRHERPHRWW